MPQDKGAFSGDARATLQQRVADSRPRRHHSYRAMRLGEWHILRAIRSKPKDYLFLYTNEVTSKTQPNTQRTSIRVRTSKGKMSLGGDEEHHCLLPFIGLVTWRPLSFQASSFVSSPGRFSREVVSRSFLLCRAARAVSEGHRFCSLSHIATVEINSSHSLQPVSSSSPPTDPSTSARRCAIQRTFTTREPQRDLPSTRLAASSLPSPRHSSPAFSSDTVVCMAAKKVSAKHPPCLPLEVLRLISTHIPAQSSAFCAFAQTSRACLAIADRVSYHTTRIDSVSRLEWVCGVFHARPRSAGRALRTLIVDLGEEGVALVGRAQSLFSQCLQLAPTVCRIELYGSAVHVFQPDTILRHLQSLHLYNYLLAPLPDVLCTLSDYAPNLVDLIMSSTLVQTLTPSIPRYLRRLTLSDPPLPRDDLCPALSHIIMSFAASAVEFKELKVKVEECTIGVMQEVTHDFRQHVIEELEIDGHFSQDPYTTLFLRDLPAILPRLPHLRKLILPQYIPEYPTDRAELEYSLLHTLTFSLHPTLDTITFPSSATWYKPTRSGPGRSRTCNGTNSFAPLFTPPTARAATPPPADEPMPPLNLPDSATFSTGSFSTTQPSHKLNSNIPPPRWEPLPECTAARKWWDEHVANEVESGTLQGEEEHTTDRDGDISDDDTDTEVDIDMESEDGMDKDDWIVQIVQL
ncbi:hypothetical protein BOTBODRAFT_504246 [Botryobasidium botryosum FD-172 SS1]|uniref:F-box domain-containing protein n=1 Tax=Botryobasidium botryosum (strain FD-172 SS1) TaxID=930990 RepID=A0A067MDR1_BOTB1|nr:hypothetical protein BOTBODRAFT_504246 [Botryobasidium botryosum FD-172 SS1]